MLNLKYLSNVFLYFLSVLNLEYIFIVGFYYLLQDYLLLIFSYYKDFSLLDFFVKENLKFLFLFFVFISCSF